eukprot:Nk52_evm1s153 gene=Nk52_evmTU1s153
MIKAAGMIGVGWPRALRYRGSARCYSRVVFPSAAGRIGSSTRGPMIMTSSKAVSGESWVLGKMGARSWFAGMKIHTCSSGKMQGNGANAAETGANGGGGEGGEKKEEVDEETKILQAALAHVPSLGWTHEAIAKGCEDVGYTGSAHGLFERGGVELAEFFVRQSNEKLLEGFATVDLSTLKVPEIIREAVVMRLRMNIPYIGRWPEAMALMAGPNAIGNAFVNLGTFVDEVWYLAGDRSTDLNWYSKRALLIGVYTTTELFMLQDSSPDYEDTWAFLDRKLENVAWLTMIKQTYCGDTKSKSNTAK